MKLKVLPKIAVPVVDVADIFVGDHLYIWYGPDNFNNRIYQVRSIVDEQVFVLRYWRKGRYWEYRIEYEAFLDILVKNGHLYKKRGKSAKNTQ